MERSAESSRRFWREVLVAGGSSVLPRWSASRASASLVTYEVALTGELLAGVRRVAGTLAVSLSSVLFAGHARVLATLCGQTDVVAGYVARGAAGPLPCRLHTGCRSWRELLAESFCAESAALTHRGAPVHELLTQLGTEGPLFETVFDPTDGDLPGFAPTDSGGGLSGVALWVGVAERGGAERDGAQRDGAERGGAERDGAQRGGAERGDGLVLRLRCRGDVWDAEMLARVGGYHQRALESLAEDVDAEHSRTFLPSPAEIDRQSGFADGAQVVDELGRPVPLGAPGAIVRAGTPGGEAVHSPVPTGEVGRRRPDGGLQLLDRCDSPAANRVECAAVAAGHEPPRTDAERRLAQTWSTLLGVPAGRLGRHDHFFDLGGTSISAVKLAIVLDRAVTARDITEHPTLAELAELAAERART